MAKARGPKNGAYVHGMSKTKTYNTWRGMIERCTREDSVGWEDYGAKGITVCDEWFDFQSFFRDMGERPDGKTLDRIDPSMGYNKQNCQWATVRDQAINKSGIPYHTFAGLSLSFGEWSELIGIERRVFVRRFYQSKWSLERTLTTPVIKHGIQS